MIKVGVLGATGYAGIETVRLLLRHPGVTLTRVVSHSNVGVKISDLYPNLRGICDMEFSALDVDDISENCDVVFTALPHGASKEIIPSLYNKGLKIIDLSGDFRYDDPAVYEKWYGQPHSAPELLEKSVYGLCELYRNKIKGARLIGNPGCYTTCSITGLYPIIHSGYADNSSIIIDAKSGVTGAGRGLKLPNLFCECTETMKAYKVATHRHTSEIEQELSHAAGENIILSFTPHLAPMKRGIFATCYINLKEKKTTEELVALYKDFYKNEELIAITKELTDTLRKNRTIDWQKRDSARARMRMLIKRLLKHHKYPPEGMDDAVQTVMTQCELWADNNAMEDEDNDYSYNMNLYTNQNFGMSMVAEPKKEYKK